MKLGRNDPCPCGSGKKYKNCCFGKTGARSSGPSANEINQLDSLFGSGRHAELEDRARSLIKPYPDSGIAWKLLGLSLQMQGKDALPALQKAAELLPNDAEAHANLAALLRARGQLEAAVASGRRALEIKPDFAEGHNNLGVVLKDLGQLDEAAASYRRALQIKPGFAAVHNNLGGVLQKLGQLDEALASCRRALELKPDFAEAHNNLGIALKERGQLGDAMASYRQALHFKPDYAEAYNNLSIALAELGQLDDALAICRRALELKPDFAEAHNNLGLILKELGRLGDAQASYLRALELKPDYAEAHSNLGIVLQDLGLHEDALACYRRALAIKPDFVDAQTNLLFAMNYTAHAPDICLEEARRYGRMVAGKVSTRFASWQCAAQPERLRVGLVSGDLRNHVVGYFLEGLLAHIDPARIELIAYPTRHEEDELTARIRRYFSAWQPLFGKSDEAAARLIHADGVHVLIDLSGHTGRNRLPVFAWKPAPIQASWLGYFATTGVAEIDYLLADQVGVPEDQRRQFTEQLWYLPDTRLCFTAPASDLRVAPLPALSSGAVTFGCFQNLAKLGDEVLAAWGKIFASLPDAKLRLQCKQLGEPAQAEQLLQRLQCCGIAPARVTTHGPVLRDAYLAAHAQVDMILDTFPYPGGTTTCEALWMGVPTLTLAGDNLLARQGASLLAAAGLEDWVAKGKEEYIAKAIALAKDTRGLAALRAGLRQQVLTSPLFDAPRFARNFEDALWRMWQSRRAR